MLVDMCQFCGAGLPERALYCASCASQVRCKACREALEPNAVACVMCGFPTGTLSAGAEPVSTRVKGTALNTLDYEEKGRARSLHVCVTDAAMREVSGALGGFIGSPFTSRVPPDGAAYDGVYHVTPTERPALHPISLPDDETPPADVTVPTTVAADMESTSVRLGRILKPTGGTFELEDRRLKATSKRDFAKRFTFLLLLAHEMQGRVKVSRSVLKQALEVERVFDTHVSSWLSTSPDLKRIEGEFALNTAGREKAMNVLNQASNASAPDGWLPGTVRRVKKNHSTEETDSATKAAAGVKKRRGIPKVVNEWVNKWKSQGISIEAHAALVERPIAEKAMIGLWAIRKSVGDDAKVVTSEQLSGFLYEALEVKTDDRSLRRALKTADVKDKVIHVGGTQYQISPSGMECVEKMMGGSSTGAARPTPRRENDSP